MNVCALVSFIISAIEFSMRGHTQVTNWKWTSLQYVHMFMVPTTILWIDLEEYYFLMLDIYFRTNQIWQLYSKLKFGYTLNGEENAAGCLFEDEHMLCVEIKGNDLQKGKMCLIHCRRLISAAAGFGQTGRGLKTSRSQRLSIAGGIGRKKMEGIKYAENVAEMFESNTLESPTSSVVVVKTKGFKGIKECFHFFSCFLPLSVPCGCIVLLHTLFFCFCFFYILGATCDASLTLMNHLPKDEKAWIKGTVFEKGFFFPHDFWQRARWVKGLKHWLLSASRCLDVIMRSVTGKQTRPRLCYETLLKITVFNKYFTCCYEWHTRTNTCTRAHKLTQ